MLNTRKIPFCKPFTDGKEFEYAKQAIESGWWTTGPFSDKFEKQFAEYVGARHCILTSSCSAALFLCYKWLKNSGHSKILLPALTFSATATEAINAGLEPVFGDVNRHDMCLATRSDKFHDCAAVVHLTGTKADTDFDCVNVVEDSAHRIQRDQCKGNPNLVCFSFYATKNMAMGEGGAICTNDDAAAEWFRKAIHHGLNKRGWDRYHDKKNWGYECEFIGYKMNCSDINAAVGLAQLEKMDEINTRRQHVVDRYNEAFGYKNDGLHIYPVLVDKRDEFVAFMKENNIGVSVHFIPLIRMRAFEKWKTDDLVNTDYFGDRLVSLPLFPDMTNEEIDIVIKKVKESNLLINE